MARIERKAFYVGTWREDIVTDTTMRQIIARSQAEKGQKVKVRLSKDGLGLSKTVLFQENFLSSFPLHDIYFLTVNHRNPTCLLCIAADPVKKYLILAIRTCNEVEAQEIISTFQALKENPTINAGNVVLRRKDNGNWTLRERSQHNADRHLQEIFKESTTTTTITATSDTPPQPNGNAGSYTPVLDGSKWIKINGNHDNLQQSHAGVQTMVKGDAGDVVTMKNEVEHLSQELRDMKFVLEKAGSVSSATLNNNTEKSHYVSVTNGGMVVAHSDGAGYHGNRPGEARVEVEDYRDNTDGVVRAHSNGSAVVLSNGRVRRQITVPEPKRPASATPSSNGFKEIPAYTVHRRVSTEFVQVSDVGHRISGTESARSSLRVKFDPESVRRSQDQHHQFRSLRTSRSSSVPTTIVRPIEHIYRHTGHGHVPLAVHPRPSILKRQPAVYVEPTPASNGAVYVTQPAPSAVYVTQHAAAPSATLPQSGRRSRPGSIHVMEGNELRVFHKTGELEDVLL